MSETSDKKFKIRQIEVKKGLAFETGKVHHNISFGVLIDINDEEVLSSIKGMAEHTLDVWLTQTMNETRESSGPSNDNSLSFDPETLKWNKSDGRGNPLELISITDGRTKELFERIKGGMSVYNGWTYWVFKDNVTIGRRKVR